MHPDQYLAWSFYGLPPSAAAAPNQTPVRPVGEVGYVVGWISDQLGRLEWRVRVDGKESWTVDTPDGERIRSVREAKDPAAVEHPVNASTKLLDLIGWGRSTVKMLATNLFVAGQCHYVHRGGRWEVVSVIRPRCSELVRDAELKIEALWPHPADPTVPDAPIVRAVPILSQLDWLTRLSEAQSSSRIGMRGVAAVADSMSTASGKDFWAELNEATQQNMADPGNLAPVVIRGPQELVEASGSGIKGFAWVVPEFPYDDQIEDRISQALKRLAYSLPIPPEVLLGLQAQSRATAFQVEASAYSAHIEPPAGLVARVAEQALSLLLGRKVVVEADPTNLLARRHSVSDVLEAFDRGAASLAYLRSVLGIPEHAAPSAEDLEILYRLRGRSDAEATPDPANVAAQDPFPSQQSALLASLSDPARSVLAELDGRADVARALFLSGATQQAADRARERVGAKARTLPALREELAAEVPHQQVAAAIGTQRLLDAGVAVEECIRHAVEPLGGTCPGLTEALCAHVRDTLEDEVAQPLPDAVLLRLTATRSSKGSRPARSA